MIANVARVHILRFICVGRERVSYAGMWKGWRREPTAFAGPSGLVAGEFTIISWRAFPTQLHCLPEPTGDMSILVRTANARLRGAQRAKVHWLERLDVLAFQVRVSFVPKSLNVSVLRGDRCRS